MKKAPQVFLVVCFLGALAAVLFGTLLKEKEPYTFFENRMLAEKPVLTAESLLNGSYFTETEQYLSDHVLFRETMLKGKTLADLYLFRRPVVNEVVVQNDVLLPFLEDPHMTQTDIAAAAAAEGENIASVARLVESYGGHYLYTAVPCQYVCYEDAYPWYLCNRADYTDASVAALRRELEKQSVHYVDMGAVFEAEGTMKEYSSTVDNHYNIRGAYRTYEEILTALAADGLTVPVLEDYTLEQLPERYLGSRLRKLFGLWPTEERQSVILPKEEIPFARSDGGQDSADTIYRPESGLDWTLYSLYMGGDMDQTVIDTGREQLPNILIYGDSFTNAVECVMWYSFGRMYSLDLRDYDDMTLGAFIEQYRPDAVVCIKDYEAILSTDGNGAGAK